MQVTFTPTAAGGATGELTVTDTGGTQAIGLSGTGAALPTDLLVGNTLTGSAPNYTLQAFPGTIAGGQPSAAQTISLSNTGGEPLESIAISASGPFQTTNNCTTQLTANASCTISVVFAPGAAQVGAETGTLTVSDALRTQTVGLSGTGLAMPVFAVTPSSPAFTGQQPGVTSAPQTLTVTNTSNGGGSMANVGFQVTASPSSLASDFSVTPAACGTIPNGGKCAVQVTFTPSLAGGVAATLTVSSSTVGVKPASVSLNGTGQFVTGLTVSPTQLIFPPVNAGQSTPAQTVTVTNTTTSAFSAITVSVAPPFAVTQNTCIGALAGGAKCTLGIEFQPTSNTATTGTLTVSAPEIATASSVALIASGGLQVSPASIAFPSTGAGTASSPVTLTVTNLAAAYSLTGLTLTAPAGFQLTANTCASTLPAQASCTVGVEFTPRAAGQQTGSLTVTTSTVQAAPVALSGMGFDFAAAASGSTSQTVASGQTASYTLSISPLDGSQGTFAFQCPTLPTNTQCAFNPATETLAAQGNVTVEIATGVASASAANRPERAPWGALPLACGVLLLPVALRRRRALLMIALLAVLVCLGVSSCTSSGGGTGGSSSGSGGSGSTPPNTYTIPVIVSSTGVQHTVTLTLTVD